MDKVRHYVLAAKRARIEARWYAQAGQHQSAHAMRREAKEHMAEARRLAQRK